MCTVMNGARGDAEAKAGFLTEWTWAVTLWLFRVFCLAWVAVVVLLAARGIALFLVR